MECFCFETILGFRKGEKLTTRKVLSRSASLRTYGIFERQKTITNETDLILQAHKVLMFRALSGDKEYFEQPKMDHDCFRLSRKVRIFSDLWAKEREKINPSAVEVEAEAELTQLETERSNLSPEMAAVNQSDNSQISESSKTESSEERRQLARISPEPVNIKTKSPTFKLKVGSIDKHFYRKDGLKFRVQWDGYDIPAMEERFETILGKDGGPDCLGKYLRAVTKRALRTILEREPSLCELLKRE